MDETLYKGDDRVFRMYLFHLALRRVIRLKQKQGKIIIDKYPKKMYEENILQEEMVNGKVVSNI